MIAVPSGARIWLAAGVTDLRRGFDGPAALVQNQLLENPFDGQVFLFGVDPTVVSPAATSITREPIWSSYRDRSDHTGSHAPKSVG
jgi:hypothetical protein